MTSIYGPGANQQYQNSAPPKVRLVIYHRFPGVELVSPKYASDNATCYISPDKTVVVGFIAQAGFNINLTQGEPIGILMYELRKNNTKQFNKNTISSEDEATCIQLVMIWKVYEAGKLHVRSTIIEHDKGCIWDRDNLMKLARCYKLCDIQHFTVENTCLMHDNTVLMTRVNVTLEEECYELGMTISQGNLNEDVWRLCYIGIDR
jgi:hypothetical protein